MSSRKIFNEMTEGRVKEIAGADNVSPRHIYNMRSGAAHNILDRAETYMNKSEGDAGIQWLCSSQGGFFFRDIERASDMDFKIVPKILKEFSEFLNVLSTSLEDGVISDEEKDRLYSEWDDLSGVVQTLKRQIEKGEYDR